MGFGNLPNKSVAAASCKTLCKNLGSATCLIKVLPHPHEIHTAKLGFGTLPDKNVPQPMKYTLQEIWFGTLPETIIMADDGPRGKMR